MNINRHIREINNNGITIIENVFTKKKCQKYINKCEVLFNFLLKKKKVNTFSDSAQTINSPFQYDSFFFQQVFFPKIDKLLKIILDKDYVLINSNLINRRKFYHPNIKNSYTRTAEWHTDSRYLGGKRVSSGLSYIVTIPLEDFSSDNGGTCYIPKSHLTTKIPKRNYNYNHRVLNVKRGDLVLFDSGVWHKGGDATTKSRWSIFNYYGPWWMKPYYLYDQMLGEKKLSKLNNNTKKMLHFYSTPPKNDHKRISTIVKD
tara:strand:+ start:244 stop:1020 length:777 start_codon:yes stop_codon:yes gene_type:complete